MSDTVKALVINQGEDKKISHEVKEMAAADLMAGDVTVAVDYSTVNYKDGMVLNGLGRLVRNYPHIPGIDFAGTVEASDHPEFRPGQKVVLNGFGVGERHWGGYASKARVKGDWLVPLPETISTKDAMAIGTAGYTAMLCVMALQDHGVSPDKGEVLVTGASGGVGSVAVALLGKLGYNVVASTGRPDNADYLKGLGATSLIDRAELSEPSDKPLLSERFAGVVDSVGDTTLANAIAQVKYGGSVAACGLAGGNALPSTVLPFILRGVNLLGVDSVMCPQPRRREAWRRLGIDLDLSKLEAMTTVEPLSALPELGGKILKGQLRGRTVIDVNAG